MSEEEYEGEDEYAPLQCVLWFDSVPSFDNPLLRDVLDDAFAHVEVDADGVRITHESLIFVNEAGVPGWGATVLTTPPAPRRPSLEQTWTWDEAADALAGSRGVVVLTESSRGWVDPWRRVVAFSAVLRTVVDAMGPVALHWPASDLVEDPAKLDDSLLGFFNVRRQPSPEAADGWIVDTLGLAGLNIPDLECHFRGLDVETISDLLADHARAFIQGTEFIGDGDPLVVDADGGFGTEFWFTARWIPATTGPGERRVVAFVPPPPYALGTLPPLESDVEDS